MIFREFIGKRDSFFAIVWLLSLVVKWGCYCCLIVAKWCHSSQNGAVCPRNLVILATLRIFAGLNQWKEYGKNDEILSELRNAAQ